MSTTETDFAAVRDKLDLTELVNRLFMYTDARNWQGLQNEVFTENVYLDMESNGGAPPGVVTAKTITDGWQQGFQGVDAVHHQGGHYLITVNADQADVYGYAVAMHYRTAALHGKTRTFVGSYEIKAERTGSGWRINHLKYNLQFADGNASLQ
ncbi:nuclear transport factor 2 family protein [Spirosoma sp. KNUC1025]|uniref:nuclear transport factor 2 family protein n=1 Tax=Spirosoma sp. KNUC1025 TaxID=2894082 RepID=UPI00386E4B37|nr:nuclear transport factor 2 family protein [Spirosoma sp. KNUC1025]